MSAEHYKNAVEVPVDADVLKQFESQVKSMKRAMLAYGISQGAVDNFQMTLRQFTLTIDALEGRSGAYHYFADGQPFYEVRFETPGSLMEMGGQGNASVFKKDDRQQGLHMFFEISMNLLNRVGDVAQAKHGIDKKDIHGGGGLPIDAAEFDTTFRCDPSKFMDSLKDLVAWRLNMLMIEDIKSAPGGPKL